MSVPYPFINPIICTKDNSIIDGQYRYSLCRSSNAKVDSVNMPFNQNEIKRPEFQEYLKKLQEEHRVKLEDWFKQNKINWKKQLLHSSSNDKMSKFIEFKDKFKKPKDYWETLSDVYKNSNNNYHLREQIIELFLADKWGSHFLMNKNEQKVLASLPEKITVYRGMTVEEKESEDFGISWSLSKKVAESFGVGYYHNYDTIEKEHTVHELEINKSDVIAFFNGRKEEEIIYLGELVEE